MSRVGLDAEGTDHYRPDIDIIPAIQEAIKWLVAVVNFGIGQKKLGEEIFQEILYTRIFETNAYSRIAFNSADLGHELWTIMAVFPEPDVLPVGSPTTAPTNPQDSEYRSDLSFRAPTNSQGSKRLTLEEWATNQGNPFAAGNEVVTTGDFRTPAYLNYSDYTSTDYTLTVPREIELRPALSVKFVGVAYIAVPTPIVDENSTIQFPFSFANIIYEKSMNYISRKQGDGTTIASVTNKDLVTLINSIQ